MYTAGVYLMPVAGGFLADRFLGFTRAVIVGGVLMMFGHLVLGVETLPFFYSGLVLLATRQRAAEAECLDAGRQPVSRPAGSCATRVSTSTTWA